ncbi:putative bifunctional diguanylate cyclase/phosphodiesterase [Aliikangiella coralliicola]|nr:EAL domain-containing protein [Aliikangiella coralliicola]
MKSRSKHPKLEALFNALQQDEPVSVLKSLLHETSECFFDYDLQLRELDELRKAYVTLETLLDTTKEAVFSFKPGGDFDRMNSAGAKLIKLENLPVETITAEDTLPALLSLLAKPDQFLLELDRIASDNTAILRGFTPFKDGREFEYYSLPKLRHGEYLGRVWCLRDITEIRRKDALIEHQAYHDNLTDLPNRTLMLASLEHAISLAKRQNKRVAVLFIDLDDFKKINDAAGHKQGDNFLIAVANRIKSCVRESDTFGRIGGDEFLIVVEDLYDTSGADETYRRILDNFKQPLNVGKYSYYVSCSIGISQYPQDNMDPAGLVRQADMAMYEAKRKGKNTYCYYHPKMEKQALNRLEIENALRHGLNTSQLFLEYQPEVDLRNNRMVGVEALLRWQLPDGTKKSPEEFIPIAEKSALIGVLTKFVLSEVCISIRSWRGTPLQGIPISVNLSGKDLQSPTFSAEVIAILNNYNVPGDQLIFEITESIFLEGISNISQVVNDLRTYGIRFAIDDFGTGYSSFRYLQLIEIDFIKIDKSFIRHVDSNPQQAAIAKSIIDIGVNLEVSLIAEGIETETELDFIKSTKCYIVQGNLIAPPKTPADILKMNFLDKLN